MNRRQFVSMAAVTGLVAAPLGASALARPDGELRCRCTRQGAEPEPEVDRHAPAGFRLDLLGPADDENRCARPGFGLKAIYAGLIGGHEFTLIHPASGELGRGGSLHFARKSIAGLEIRWADRRAYLPVASLFGHRRQPGRYRLEVDGPAGDRLALSLRLVKA